MTISVSLNGDTFEQVLYNNEEDFEQLVAKNAETIFGDKAIYIDAKKKIKTSTLGGTIPDGFLIDLGDIENPEFYLVEVELQSHDFFKHIFPQITKFFAFYRNSKQRHKLAEVVYTFLKDEFGEDTELSTKLIDIIKSNEVYKFLKDAIDGNQNILIVIDGPKPEFDEIMDTYTDTWAKMVKIQIVNHFRKGENNIIIVEPPFQNLPFGDALSLSPDKETAGTSKYTEEFHLQNRPQEVVEIYRKLKQEFINVKSALRFNPTRHYIGVADVKLIAYILVRKNRIRLVVLMAENEVKEILKSEHHKIVSHSESTQYSWGGNNPNCTVQITDTEYWDEIQKLMEKLVRKYQER